MLLIPCPWCGERDQSEFSYGCEANIVRPDVNTASDEDWGDYLYMRHNVKGINREQWVHTDGCCRWFYVERDTVSYQIKASYRPGE